MAGLAAMTLLAALEGPAQAGDGTIRVAELFGGAKSVSASELAALKGTGLSDPPPSVPVDGALAVILWDESKRVPAPRGGGISPGNGASVGISVTPR
jgi:hypothetical protein